MVSVLKLAKYVGSTRTVAPDERGSDLDLAISNFRGTAAASPFPISPSRPVSSGNQELYVHYLIKPYIPMKLTFYRSFAD